jgi:hypothetical protein
MTFGEALRHELIQIVKLNQKVFPIVAPEATGKPFLIYQREDIEFKKTLSGTMNKANAVYILTLITDSYSEKEAIEVEVKDKLLSFLQRTIGDEGPYIQNITVRLGQEGYVLEADSLTSKIRLEVNY